MNKIVEKAKKINKFQKYIPELEEGEIVELNDLWDGEGEVPEDSYSYLLTDNGENDDTYGYDININYVFEIIEEKKNPLDTVIKIIQIEFV
ncbi:hypothetical protein FDE98_17975 [Clostridium sporogenes]|uniref:Uncharacterized protein n=2 Tax=Clostridium TaxID=1485 RepID=A0A7X5PDD3_CLOSG|nr:MULTISPECIES: hypothetical protein [Clostridium]AJD29287.1 hypothetical protein T258_4068 [Clostridium botulinum Prevot_594]NCI20605.1 hypothetical protein [Clostridium botulinum]NDI38207.1 hypothetical protein [Clostridium botulinum]NFL98428.1 hypothetical protein [Clostridium botulinum]NFP56246.1 hypothetical protein [Clostridium botulinum]